jgi:hypothetical protein
VAVCALFDSIVPTIVQELVTVILVITSIDSAFALIVVGAFDKINVNKIVDINNNAIVI